MLAGGTTDSSWMVARRFAALGAAVLAFQLYAVTTATPLVSTEALAPPTTTVVPAVAESARPVPRAQAGTLIGHGFAGPVSAAAARYAHDYRLRYHEVAAPTDVAAPTTVPAVIGLGKAGIADIEALPPPPPVTTQHPGLTVHDDPQSHYQLELDTRRRVIHVTVAGMPNVQFEIDYRDRASDLHRMGITPVLVGHRLEGNFHRFHGEMTFPLITPTFDAGKVTYTTVTNEDDSLLIRFDGGPYANLSPGRDNDGSTFLEVRISVTDRRVRMDLAGLYYVRPAVGAEMFIKAGDTSSTLVVDKDRPLFLTYIENPTSVEVTDPAYGSYRMRTDVTRLQVQWDGVGTAFELDFDHAYKDRGQTNVQTRLVFPTPSET